VCVTEVGSSGGGTTVVTRDHLALAPCCIYVCMSVTQVRAEYLEATLGLVKRLEISKELIRECVTVPAVVPLA